MTEEHFFQMSFKELAELYEQNVPKVKGVYVSGLPSSEREYGWTDNTALMQIDHVSSSNEFYVNMLSGGRKGEKYEVEKQHFYVIPSPIVEILCDLDDGEDELKEILSQSENLYQLLSELEDRDYCLDTDEFFEDCLEELQKHGFTFTKEDKPPSKLNFMEEPRQEEKKKLGEVLSEIQTTAKKSVIEKTHTITQITPKKENNSMFKSMNFLKGFDTIDTSKVKMTMFGIGVENSQGIVQTYNALTHELTDVTDFVMEGFGGMENMVFVFPAQKVKKGDLVVFNKNFCFVTGIQGKRITAVDFNTNQEVTIVKQKHAMGFNFVPKVMCPFGNMFTATEKDPVGGFESMLPMMMMMNMSKGDSDSKGGMSGMMEMMMMSQMFGGSGENPFAKMFGGMSADEEEETTEE